MEICNTSKCEYFSDKQTDNCRRFNFNHLAQMCNKFQDKYSIGLWNDSDIEKPPEGVPVLGVIEHFDSASKRHAVVIYVNGDDHAWEFDGCELANEYNVIRWASLPMLN